MRVRMRAFRVGVMAVVLAVVLAGQVGSFEKAVAQQTAFTVGRDMLPERPCEVRFEQGRPKLVVQLLRVRGDWKLEVFVSRIPAALIPYFDAKGLVDQAKFRKAVAKIDVGGEPVEVTGARIMAVQRSELRDGTEAILTVETLRRVALVLRAPIGDDLSFGDLAAVSGVRDGLAAFGACAWQAIGIAPNEALKMDPVAEYRLMFERTLPIWVAERAAVESCFGGEDDGAVDAAIGRAAGVFVPGFFNYDDRADWRKEMKWAAGMAEMEGKLSVSKSGCSHVGPMLEARLRALVDGIIDGPSR